MERLRFGLLALIHRGQTGDYRDTIIEVALLDNSARKLSVRLEDLFEELRRLAATVAATWKCGSVWE